MNTLPKFVGFAPGKVILFGEHAVVHGQPAISAAIRKGSYCTINFFASDNQNRISLEFITLKKYFMATNLGELVEELPQKFKHFGVFLKKISERRNLDVKDIEIKIRSDLWPNAGLGSSASTSIAMIRAFNQAYTLNFSKDDVLWHSLEMERSVHGNPSGIDNSTCTLGGAIWFENGKAEPIKRILDIHLLVVHSGEEHDTKKAVNLVQHKFANNSEKIRSALLRIGEISLSAKKALRDSNLKRVGALMNKNHAILKTLGLSTPRLEEIIRRCRNCGAWGAKLTGAGQGGCAIALGKKAVLENLRHRFQKQEICSFLTRIDQGGPVEHE